MSQSIHDHITALQEFSIFGDDIFHILFAGFIAGSGMFLMNTVIGIDFLNKSLPMVLAAAFGAILLTATPASVVSSIEYRGIQDDLHESILQNVQENIDLEEISLLEAAHLGDMYIAAFEAMNDEGEKTKFHMAYSSDHDMMIPSGDVFSEDIPVIPESYLATIIE